MQAVFHLAEDELDEPFLQTLKAQFKSQHLTIVIDAQPTDETDFLLDNPVNAERLMNKTWSSWICNHSKRSSMRRIILETTAQEDLFYWAQIDLQKLGWKALKLSDSVILKGPC